MNFNQLKTLGAAMNKLEKSQERKEERQRKLMLKAARADLLSRLNFIADEAGPEDVLDRRGLIALASIEGLDPELKHDLASAAESAIGPRSDSIAYAAEAARRAMMTLLNNS